MIRKSFDQWCGGTTVCGGGIGFFNQILYAKGRFIDYNEDFIQWNFKTSWTIYFVWTVKVGLVRMVKLSVAYRWVWSLLPVATSFDHIIFSIWSMHNWSIHIDSFASDLFVPILLAIPTNPFLSDPIIFASGVLLHRVLDHIWLCQMFVAFLIMSKNGYKFYASFSFSLSHHLFNYVEVNMEFLSCIEQNRGGRRDINLLPLWNACFLCWWWYVINNHYFDNGTDFSNLHNRQNKHIPFLHHGPI